MRLSDYKAAAPFTVNELLEAVNTLMGDEDMSIRTIRYYVGQGVIGRPLGAPKFARYGYEHLVCILAARMLQDKGWKLERIAAELSDVRAGKADKYAAKIDDWLPTRVVRERRKTYGGGGGSGSGRPAVPTRNLSVHRIILSDRAAIEVAAGGEVKKELSDASKALSRLIKSLNE